MVHNACFQLREAGTAVWLDQLSRELIESGKLRDLMTTAALTGVTSNPAIFHKAMTQGTAYDEQISTLAVGDLTTEDLYEDLAILDIQMACDILRPAFNETQGADGYVSFEVSPHLARDTEGTMAAARRLHHRVARPNVFIKIPGTPEGEPAIEQMLVEGIPINITLLFSIEAYEGVAEAYVRAMQARLHAGQSTQVASVASFFVSRIDTLTDKKLDELAAKSKSDQARMEIQELRGKTAIANARLAYQSFLRIFMTPQFRELAAKGTRVQRPLWASTSTKNPAYRDVLYVEALVGRNTVNTMPLETLDAMLDHGKVIPDSVEQNVEEARRHFQRLEDIGISFKGVADQLIEEAIQKFNEPYDQLLQALEMKRAAVRTAR